MISVSDEISWRNYLADLIWTSLPAGSMKVRNREQFNFRCPICGDSKKSLTKKRGFYYIPTSSYHCFNCEANLTGFRLLKKIAPENVYHDAVVQYRNMRLLSLGKNPDALELIPDESNELVCCDPVPAWRILLKEPDVWETPTVLMPEPEQYLNSRGIDSQFARQNFLSIRNKKSDTPFILIPYTYIGECIFYQLHNYTKNPTYPKYLFPHSIDLNDQEKPVFNIDNVDPSWKYIIACEGVYDALSYKNGVSLGGRVITEFQARMLFERWPHHQVVAAFDNDRDGKRSMMKMCKEKGAQCFLDTFALFDKFHVKDANEFIQLGQRAKDLLKDKAFLEKCIKSPLEMEVGLLLGDPG